MTTEVSASERGAPHTTNPARSFDELLGAPTTRYFATGYKRVGYSVRFGAVSTGEYGSVALDGFGTVDYPVDWSLAPSGQPRPSHLSSIDALVFGVAAVEHAMSEVPGMCETNRAVIDHVSIRSGARPGAELSEVPVSAMLMPREFGLYAELRVGAFRIHAQLREAEVPARRAGRLRPYWDGYRLDAVTSELLEVDLRDLSVVTMHTAWSPKTGGAAGIDSALWPGLTHIDNVALFGQLAQILAQTTAGVVRGSIDNLWMRRMAFTRIEHLAPTRFQARARLVEHSMIERGGKVMHSLQMEAVSDHGVEAEALFGFVVESR
ncbi:AvrD family protein [Microbacterium lacticum]